VRHGPLRRRGVTAIRLGRGSPTRLGATYPPAPRDHVNAGLLGVAARRDCPFHPSRGLAPRRVAVDRGACAPEPAFAGFAARAANRQNTLLEDGEPRADSSLLL